MNWSPMNRPVTLGEMAAAFRVDPEWLDRLAGRHDVEPALWIGRLRLYDTNEVRRIHALIGQRKSAASS